MEGLKSKAMLVQLNTSHWTARKYDAKVTKEIDESHGAHDSGRFNKTLIVSTMLTDIASCVGKARTYHYSVTLPWDDANQRLLPVAEYFNYVAKMEEHQNEHAKLVNAFLQEYPALRENALQRLNTLFNEADYPHISELPKKFNISYNFTPISDASDLRVEISKSEAKEIRKNIEEGMKGKINNAKASIVERANKAVQAAYEKLSDKKATFRDSLIGNITEVVEIIPIVNFDDDSKLDDLRKKLKKMDFDVADLRKDKAVRKKAAKKAKKILKYIKTIRFGDEVAVKEIVIENKPVKTKRLR